MIQLAWPWLLLALPLPWLVYRFVPPAPGVHGAALRAPFYRDLATVTGAAKQEGNRWVHLAMAAACAGMSPLAQLNHEVSGLAGIRSLRALDERLRTGTEATVLSEEMTAGGARWRDAIASATPARVA